MNKLFGVNLNYDSLGDMDGQKIILMTKHIQKDWKEYQD